MTTSLTMALALGVTEVSASAVQSYNYTDWGSIDNRAGVAPIYFNGSYSAQSFTTPGTISLGQFDTAAILPSSATLTYNNTPFTISLNVFTTSATGFNAPYYTYQINGTLNGSITGAGGSTMVASVSSITGISDYVNGVWTTPPFPVAELQVNAPQGINAPNGYNDGITPLYAQVNPTLLNPVPAPEPASIAVFGVGLAAWGIRRRIIRSKRPSID